MSVKSHIEKTRLFFFVDSSDEETCEECSIEVVVSANFKSSSKAAIWVIGYSCMNLSDQLRGVLGRGSINIEPSKD
jgi:hypothetical protein